MIVLLTPIMVLTCVRASSYVSSTRRTYFLGTPCPLKQLHTSCFGIFSNAFPRAITTVLAGYPLSTSSVYLICMKYRIIFLIIIVISLGQIIFSYIANTARTHARTNGRTHAHACARTHANACTPTHTSPYRYSMGLCQLTVTARSAGDNSWSLAIEINTGTGGPVSRGFECFSHAKIARPN